MADFPEPTPRLEVYHREARRWGKWVIPVLLLLYWIWAALLTGAGYTSDRQPAFWAEFATAFPLLDTFTPLVLFLARFIHWQVFLHFIPLIVGWYLANWAVAGFLETMYALPEHESGGALLGRLKRPRPPVAAGRMLANGSLLIRRTQFEEQRQQRSLLRVGGPGGIIVTAGEAVVTERNGRLSRILGPGVHALRHFEYVRNVFDLYPQEWEEKGVQFVTADGIELTADLSVTFQIAPADDAESDQPVPFSREAVRKIAAAELVFADGQVGAWESSPLNVTTDCLRAEAAKHSLDEILFAGRANGLTWQDIKHEVEKAAHAALADNGIALLSIRLGLPEAPPEIGAQWLQSWQAQWNRQQRIQMADDEAEILQEIERARAEGEAMMINAILEGLQRARQQGVDVDAQQIITLRLIETLEQMAYQTRQISPLPDHLIPQLRSLRRQLDSINLPGGGEDNA